MWLKQERNQSKQKSAGKKSLEINLQTQTYTRKHTQSETQINHSFVYARAWHEVRVCARARVHARDQDRVLEWQPQCWITGSRPSTKGQGWERRAESVEASKRWPVTSGPTWDSGVPCCLRFFSCSLPTSRLSSPPPGCESRPSLLSYSKTHNLESSSLYLPYDNTQCMESLSLALPYDNTVWKAFLTLW